ncbi:uncharacterized protein LOC115075828 [Rhinatrema bivittatum]|uniref:uncharacterized protein LOC115075828 n=1 Tax=Rhinatrema bivittatum TaxID=194408 RepID=UPI001127626B|nr:uncharacterized protein LOC115075828 [Rhinatrema bivittatum]XP_029432509.1 uncharacterized protein LOC115075828 [Rhinatrema bivittatum]
MSVLAMRQKLGYRSNSLPVPATSCVEPRPLGEVESKGASSRNPEESAYRKRRRKQRFPRHFSMSPATTTPAHVLTELVAEEPTQRNGLDLFEELRIYGHPGLCFTTTAYPEIPPVPVQETIHPKASTSRSDLPQNIGSTEGGLEEHFPPEIGWDTRSMLEKNKEDCEQSQKRNETHQYYFPFQSSDFTAVSSDLLVHNRELSQNSRAFTLPQQFKCRQMQSPKLWALENNLLKEGLSSRHQGQTAKNSFVSRDTQSVEGTAPEAQTSFDVLKSIWNWDIRRQGTAKASVSKTSGCSFMNRLIPPQCKTSYQGLCPEQGHLGNTLKLYTEGIFPKHSHPVYMLDSEASAQEYTAEMPRYTAKAPINGTSVRACHHELPLPPPCLAVDQTGAQEWLESWEHRLPLARSTLFTSQQEYGGKSRCGIGDWFYALEPRSFLNQNPQLPLAFFPPSEALEHSCSPTPYITFHGSSPEAWVFPRMKLY